MNTNQELKNLIEDLLNDRLSEAQIKRSMESLGVKYSEIPTTRWKLLLDKLEQANIKETQL